MSLRPKQSFFFEKKNLKYLLNWSFLSHTHSYDFYFLFFLIYKIDYDFSFKFKAKLNLVLYEQTIFDKYFQKNLL